jgi:hypothetical protein
MLVLLAILIFVYNFTAVSYSLYGLEPLATVEFLYYAAFPCGVVWWLRAEKRQPAVSGLYCEGMLASYAWAVIVPYQLLKTRGKKGLLPLLVLLASYFGSIILAEILYFAFVADLSTY